MLIIRQMYILLSVAVSGWDKEKEASCCDASHGIEDLTGSGLQQRQ